MEEFKAGLLNGIQEVISMLNERKSFNDLELCAMRLEVLAERALGNDAIPYLLFCLLNALYFWKRMTTWMILYHNLEQNSIFIIIRMYCKLYIFQTRQVFT